MIDYRVRHFMAEVGAAARATPEPRRRVAQASQGETKRGRRERADPRLIRAVDLPPATRALEDLAPVLLESPTLLATGGAPVMPRRCRRTNVGLSLIEARKAVITWFWTGDRAALLLHPRLAESVICLQQPLVLLALD